MTTAKLGFPISNPILRRELSLLAAYGNMTTAVKKVFTVDDRHCFEVWAEGGPVETICLKLSDGEATQLENEIANWLSHNKR